MYVLIIVGLNSPAATKICDQSEEMVGRHGDVHFYENNCGNGKLFPGRPTYTVRGIEVSCFIRWSKKGYITSTILKERTRDTRSLKSISERELREAFFYLSMVIDHVFRLIFLGYINNKDHVWKFCIGIPYGATLWQVGDRKEQKRIV